MNNVHFLSLDSFIMKIKEIDKKFIDISNDVGRKGGVSEDEARITIAEIIGIRRTLKHYAKDASRYIIDARVYDEVMGFDINRWYEQMRKMIRGTSGGRLR